MSAVSEFLANNYIWFLILGIILIFALIGYIVDAKNPKSEKLDTVKLDSKNEVNKKVPIKEEKNKEEKVEVLTNNDSKLENTEVLTNLTNSNNSKQEELPKINDSEPSPLIKEDIS